MPHPDLQTITDWVCRATEEFLAAEAGSITPEDHWDRVINSLDETDLLLRAEREFGVALPIWSSDPQVVGLDPLLSEIRDRRPFKVGDFAALIHRCIEVGRCAPCAACGYDLTGVEMDRCPECGVVRSARD